jgi:4-carboxymuconolactone decarboxylase
MIPRPPGIHFADWLAAAATGGPEIGAAADGSPAGNIDDSGLDARTHALVRLAAMVGDGQRPAAYEELVATALDYGVTAEEITGLLVALLPILGPARISDVAPHVIGAIDRATADIPVPPP